MTRTEEAPGTVPGSGWRLEFPAGLPAFEQERDFQLLAPAETEPLVFLQSLRTAGLCFIAVPVERILPDYQLALSAEDAGTAGFAQDEAAPDSKMVLAVLTCAGPLVTANLLAPVVVNRASAKAVQAVRSDNRYSARTPVHIGPDLAARC